MKIALFRCCMTAMGLDQYESSTNAVMEKLGIEFVDLREFNCCGYPLRNFSFRAFVLASARNLALAEKRDLQVLTMCNCCYGSLKHAEHLLQEDSALRDEINAGLEREGLRYEGRTAPKHLLQILHDDIGIESLRTNIKKTFRGLRVAVHYGCHILRPSSIVQFDNAFSPVKFDQLVEMTGAESVPWLTKLECCGSPLMGVNDELSMDLTEKKLVNARKGGADYLCVACPYCQMQFDKVQQMMLARRGSEMFLPSILYLQLLGLCLGIDSQRLGLERNRLPITGVHQYLFEQMGEGPGL
jgi:heterodisulfide reductase subunit B2